MHNRSTMHRVERLDTRPLPVGAELSAHGVRLRVWAPDRSRVAAVVEPGADEYSVDVDVPLLDDHSGVVAPRERPHGLTRSSSCSEALPCWSETRLTCCTESEEWWD